MSDTDEVPAFHKNEGIKERSRALRGGIAEGLMKVITGALTEDDTQLTKFHGIYQQDDRDLRAERGRRRHRVPVVAQERRPRARVDRRSPELAQPRRLRRVGVRGRDQLDVNDVGRP